MQKKELEEMKIRRLTVASRLCFLSRISKTLAST